MNPDRKVRACKAAAVAGAVVALLAWTAAAQAPGPTTAFENTQFRYTVSLPAGCRHDEGPGTLDAICAADLDAEKSAAASAAASLVLEVGAEIVADDAGKTAAELAQRYGETAFKDELAEAICGEQDKARVKVANVQQVSEEARVVYTADVTCPEIKFLQLGERQALVRFLITPGTRYRLMARALKEDFEKQKEMVDAFFASFRVLPTEKKN